MTLSPRLEAHHVQSLLDAGCKPEDAVMPCERCGAMPAPKVDLVGVPKRLCSPCNALEYSSNWEIWNS
ncbi:hypothetical protein ACUXAV_004548 [Cupriavidus metallidurans]|uniref:hypothetical protein n=1 Tax=Cupriavidus metallidurans TaxID=119219 RepID=UPI0004933876|nr:hypothetical protein [Cupriavidus metallidurans]MDE4919565.1 hypothetical protein [Cupriavidus metallidurans]